MLVQIHQCPSHLIPSPWYNRHCWPGIQKQIPFLSNSSSHIQGIQRSQNRLKRLYTPDQKMSTGCWDVMHKGIRRKRTIMFSMIVAAPEERWITHRQWRTSHSPVFRCQPRWCRNGGATHGHPNPARCDCPGSKHSRLKWKTITQTMVIHCVGQVT